MVIFAVCLIATNAAWAVWLALIYRTYSAENAMLIKEIKRRDAEILKIVEIAYDNGLPTPALQEINNFMFTYKKEQQECR